MKGFSKRPSINQEDPHDENVCNPRCANFLLLPLCIFDNLIIGEAVRPPLPDHPFLQVCIVPLMPQRSDNKGRNNRRRLRESNRKSCLQVARAWFQRLSSSLSSPRALSIPHSTSNSHEVVAMTSIPMNQLPKDKFLH